MGGRFAPLVGRLMRVVFTVVIAGMVGYTWTKVLLRELKR